MTATLPQDKKLTILFRVEPGSLGPDGKEQAQGFCDHSQQQLAALDADFICWQIIPRFDKTLPELEYKLSNKRLTRPQAQKYLSVFGQDIDEIEDHLISEMDNLITRHQASL
ncbi:MAG: hypothetical protein V7752_13190 [Halopseudomonas sp.]